MGILSTLHAALFDRTDERALYVCAGCGRSFEVQRQVCPECGGFDLSRTSWEQ